jgi:hypothetical protein
MKVRRYVAIVKAVAILAALYVSFWYRAVFSARQSAVLALLGWIGYGLYSDLDVSRRGNKAFSPFCVSVQPNWYPLLTDFKVVRNEENWQRLHKAIAKVPPADYSLFRSGFVFTVIAPPSGGGLPPGLAYWDNRKIFVTKVELSESISERGPGVPGAGGEHPVFNYPSWGGGCRVWRETASR